MIQSIDFVGDDIKVTSKCRGFVHPLQITLFNN